MAIVVKVYIDAERDSEGQKASESLRELPESFSESLRAAAAAAAAAFLKTGFPA